MRSLIAATFIVAAVQLFQPSYGASNNLRHRGGQWEPIRNVNARDVTDAAEATWVLMNESKSEDYDFVYKIQTATNKCLRENTARVHKGKCQIVSRGKHYEFQIEVLDCHGLCVGSFDANVYAHTSKHGDMKVDVKNLGEEKPCPNHSGGKSTIAVLEDPDVVNAANFALSELYQSTKDYSFKEQVTQSNCIFNAKVLDGVEDVSTAMNYSLEIEVIDCDNECVGVFEAEIRESYVGEGMSVTKWGREKKCPDQRHHHHKKHG